MSEVGMNLNSVRPAESNIQAKKKTSGTIANVGMVYASQKISIGL